MTRALLMTVVAVLSWGHWGHCQAEALRLCERNVPLTADQQDKVFRFGGIVKEINLAYVPEAVVGDYVIVHVGFAIGIVDEKEAQQVFEYLKQMDELVEH